MHDDPDHLHSASAGSAAAARCGFNLTCLRCGAALLRSLSALATVILEDASFACRDALYRRRTGSHTCYVRTRVLRRFKTARSVGLRTPSRRTLDTAMLWS